jgi:hypothetical protein
MLVMVTREYIGTAGDISRILGLRGFLSRLPVSQMWDIPGDCHGLEG